MFRFNKGFNITIIVLSILIVTATAILIAVFPDEFELIFGTGTFVFVSLGMFVSLQSLDTATAARLDSEKSADATVASAESAYKALQLAVEESARAKERYRIENSSLLKLHKGEMYVPLTAPFSPQSAYFRANPRSKKDYGTFFLSNSRSGAASTIDLYLSFVNAHEFEGFVFNTNEIEEPESLFDQYQLHSGIFPQYKIEVVYFEDERHVERIFIGGEDLKLEPEEKGRQIKRTRKVASPKPRRVGTLVSKEEFLFDLPLNYRTLAQQFFLERIMVRNEDAWITPNPRLRVRVEYTEEVLEHMNDFTEARRVKEFEITCSDNVDLAREISEESGKQVGLNVLRCNFNTQVIYDRPLSEISAEESTKEETIYGSTGSTEG